MEIIENIPNFKEATKWAHMQYANLFKQLQNQLVQEIKLRQLVESENYTIKEELNKLRQLYESATQAQNQLIIDQQSESCQVIKLIENKDISDTFYCFWRQSPSKYSSLQSFLSDLPTNNYMKYKKFLRDLNFDENFLCSLQRLHSDLRLISNFMHFPKGVRFNVVIGVDAICVSKILSIKMDGFLTGLLWQTEFKILNNYQLEQYMENNQSNACGAYFTYFKR